VKIATMPTTAVKPRPGRGAVAMLLAVALGAAACGGGTTTSSLGPSASPSPSAGQARGTVAGTVTSFDGTTLVLSERSGGTVTVTTSASTVVMKVQAASVSDILPNDRVVVTGPAGVAGSVTATAIVLANPSSSSTGGGGFGRPGGRGRRATRPTPSAGARRGIAGTVSFIQGSTLTVKTASGSSVQVVTTPTTTVSQTLGAALSDITTGEVCRVSGTKNADGSYNAVRIVIGAVGSVPAQLG
jgi:RNase P/RNase MRP subunit p29